MNKFNEKFPPSAQRRLTACLAGLAFCLLAILLVEPAKGEALKTFFVGPFSSLSSVGGLISAATPAVFLALGVSVVFQCRRYSFAVIGSFLLSSGLVTMFLLRGNEKPGWYLVPTALLIAVAAGAAVAVIPAWLAVRRRVNVTLSSLLLNYLLLQAVSFLLLHSMRDPAAGQTASFEIPQRMWLAEIIPTTGIRIGTLLAAAAALVLYLLLYHGRLGYGIRAVGASESLAGYVGLSAGGVAMTTQVLAGALAGLGGAVEMMGIQPRYIWNGTFPAITVVGVLAAILVDYNPAWVPLSALFLTYLWSGASALSAQSGFPEELALAAAAVVVLVLFALRQARVADGLVNFFQKLRSLRRPAASADGKKAEDAGQNGPDGEVG